MIESLPLTLWRCKVGHPPSPPSLLLLPVETHPYAPVHGLAVTSVLSTLGVLPVFLRHPALRIDDCACLFMLRNRKGRIAVEFVVVCACLFNGSNRKGFSHAV